MATNFGEFEQKCKSSIEHYKNDLNKLRTGRAQSSMLDVVFVDYYGSSVQLKTLGMINTDSSASSKEKEVKRIGPVPVPCTLL